MDEQDVETPDEGSRGDPTLFDAIVDDLDVQSVDQAKNYERGLRHIADIRRRFDDPYAEPYTSRTPCPRCRTTDAVLIRKGNQNTVRCAQCRYLLYNAPKTETGEKPRTVKTVRTAIKASQQALIFDRDGGRCVLCGSTDDLTIGHLLSLDEGVTLGATELELNSNANLAAMCEGCNLGLRHGPSSINPRTYAVIMWRLVQAELSRTR